MAQTTLQRQVSKKCTHCPRARSNRLRCHASTSQEDVSRSLKLAPAVLAVVIATNSGAMCLDLIAPKPVLADTEEENLTPYERRQRELEKRRELLRQAREKALAKASSVEAAGTEKATEAVVSSNESRSSEVSKLSSELKASAADSYLSQSKKNRLEPAPAAVPDASWWQSSTTEPTPAPAAPAAPTPAPVTPAPAAATEPAWWETVSKTEPVKAPELKAAVTKAPEPKPAPKPVPVVETKPGKRTGPLPLWLAEFLVLGALGGSAVAFTKYLDETSAQVVKYTKELENALLKLKVPTLGGN